MARTITRAQLIRGDYRGERQPIRPPWSLEESIFVERCTRCDRCIEVCPTQHLARGVGGFPSVDFQRGECEFCGDCVHACAHQAFIPQHLHSSPWSVKLSIAAHCLTHNGVVCRGCGEQCEHGAIQFKAMLGGISSPYLNSDLCTGCGACVAPCPVAAITVATAEQLNPIVTNVPLEMSA